VINGESFARPLMTLVGSMTAKLPEHSDTPGQKGGVFLIPYAVIWTLVTLMAASRLKETREGTKKAESGF
jgi:hypothetical protein